MFKLGRRNFLQALLGIPAASVAQLVITRDKPSSHTTDDLGKALAEHVFGEAKTPARMKVGLTYGGQEISGEGYARADFNVDESGKGSAEFGHAPQPWGTVDGWFVVDQRTGETILSGSTHAPPIKQDDAVDFSIDDLRIHIFE